MEFLWAFKNIKKFDEFISDTLEFISIRCCVVFLFLRILPTPTLGLFFVQLRFLSLGALKF